MSTDLGSPGRRTAGSFRKTFILAVVVLALLAAGLAVGNILQGPRVASTAVNAVGTVEQQGTRLVLTPNQRLREIDPAQVVLEPAAEYSLTQDNGTITVTFEQLLAYDTSYTLTVADAVSSSTGVSSTLEAEFTTPQLEVSTLVRGAISTSGSLEDRVIETNVSGGGEPRILFTAPRIQEYALTDAFVAVIEQDTAGLGTVGVAPRAEPGPAVPLNVDATGSFSSLAADAESGLIGFVIDGQHADGQTELVRSLYVFDTSDTSFRPQQVTGPDGTPLMVSTWAFAPRTGALIAQTLDEQLFLVNVLAGTPAESIGQAQHFHGFVPGTATAVTSGVAGYTLFDLSAGTAEPLTPAPMTLSETQYLTQTSVLDPEGTQISAVADAAAGLADVTVELADASGQRTLFDPGDSGEWLRDVCISPNGQYLAVETGLGAQGPDGYAVLPGMKQSTTTVIDIASGTELRRLTGFLTSWCR